MRASHLLSIVLTGSLTFAAIACSSDDSSSNGGNNNTGGTTTTTGGTTSTGGTTTTGGTTGSGGATGGGTGTGGTTSTEGVYIDAATAGLSIGTGAYDYVDMGGSTVKLTNPESGKICGKGTAAQVVNMMYSEIWGGGIAVQLAAEPGSFDASAYDGISFTITGLPSAIRVGVTVAADSNNAFFTSTVSEGANTLLWSDLAQGDWVTPAGTLDLATLTNIQFQVPSAEAAAIDFDFCVTDVKFVGGGIGAGGAQP